MKTLRIITPPISCKYLKVLSSSTNSAIVFIFNFFAIFTIDFNVSLFYFHKNNSTYLGFYNNELKYLLENRIKNLNVND